MDGYFNENSSADIENIGFMCVGCPLQLTCNARYLLEAQRKSFILNKCPLAIKNNDNTDNNFELECENSDSKDSNSNSSGDDSSDASSSSLFDNKSALKRSILIKKPSTGKLICDNRCCQTRKVVRFADSLGLELAKIREIQSCQPVFTSYYSRNNNNKSRKYRVEDSTDDDDDEGDIDEYTASAYYNRHRTYAYSKASKKEKENESSFDFENRKLRWRIVFSQPCLNPEFFNLLRNQKVSLEYIHTSDKWVIGLVRVLNVTFHKRVFIRYTTNKWSTHTEIEAGYVQNSCDGLTDRFNFRLALDEDVLRKMITNAEETIKKEDRVIRLEFAIRFESEQDTYWDNNNNTNYQIECLYIHNKIGGNSKTKACIFTIGCDN